MPSHRQAYLDAEAEKPYAPHDVLDETVKTGVVGLGAGFFLAAIRNAMSKRNVGAFGVFTRGSPIIGICGTAGLFLCTWGLFRLAILSQ